jgi:hypothetical protein
MKKFAVFAIFTMIMWSCNHNPPVLYQSSQFTVYTNKVIQGDNLATIVSPTHIISNYKNKASENYSRLITFKFSINEKDNERPSGADHWLLIGDEHQSPVLVFGQPDAPKPDDPGTKLPVNYEYTFRLDMRPVLKQFDEKGYFETFDDTRIAKADFKGVYIAGGALPMTWDFVNLEEKNLVLTDPDGDGIYEIKLVLNPFDPKSQETKEWNLTADLSAKPSYHSDQPIVDALFNLSEEEGLKNIETDSTFRTGAKWGGVWTRDVSYSIFLAFAYHQPDVAKISLMRKVKRGRIIQDTGSGGAWPVSSDRTIWANAAWELYKITGDTAWLKQSYQIIKNTLDDDYQTLTDPVTGMFKGESSFLDWREQTYPKWMSNMDIAESENLGTNVVHYRAHQVLIEMAKLLGEPYDVYQQRAGLIKAGINQYLWMSNKGYFGQYLYGRSTPVLSPKSETLGEALSVLFDVADSARASSIISHCPVTPFGATCIYPQIPGIPPYHNNAVWPFVQSYWNLAAAKVGNEEALNHGLACIYRPAALFLTNYENFVAQTGDYVGTEINSDRMLWSMAGNMAMVHRLFMGMNFEPNGIRFQPVIPKTYGGTKTLSDFTYRKAKLNITVKGFGNQIKAILIDGNTLKDAFLPADITGKHQIEITMANNPLGKTGMNLVKNKFTLPNPQVQLSGDSLIWKAICGATLYQVYQNGKLLKSVTDPFLKIDLNQFAEYAVIAVDAEGTGSFSSEPVLVTKKENVQIVEIEDYLPKANLPYTNFSGKGFVEITQAKNRQISLIINCPNDGVYLLDFRYANGTGPWNTDNNCGIRSIYVNGKYQGVMVFPQRGTNEWSDWGFTNSIKVNLHAGKNAIALQFDDWNTNMDGEINDALVDYMRVIEVE